MSAAELPDFAWRVPRHFNIGEAVCDHWIGRDPGRVAIIEVDEDGHSTRHSYRELGQRAARLSHVLARHGIALRRTDAPGDRVGVLLPQSIETAVAHVAVTRMGGISLPLFTLFGPQALLHRLRDSGARAIVTDAGRTRYGC